jgi:hypothetical protein
VGTLVPQDASFGTKTLNWVSRPPKDSDLVLYFVTVPSKALFEEIVSNDIAEEYKRIARDVRCEDRDEWFRETLIRGDEKSEQARSAIWKLGS